MKPALPNSPATISCRHSRRSRYPKTTKLVFIAGIGAALFCLVFTLAAASASADKHKKDKTSSDDGRALKNKFAGKLPISELSEDEAISHALNRLAYGPRPGDVERIKQMGLEKWVDQQLNPDSIDDSAVETRLQKYHTLRMSSKELLEQFPDAGQAARQQGMTKEEAQDELREKRRDAMAAVPMTGNDELDKANRQLAAIQGPNRPVAELSMAKIDRAVYSQRQLEAIMEDFWFNHLMSSPIKAPIAGS